MGSIGPEHLGNLLDAHTRALVLYSRQWCEGLEAEDVVQEAFLSLARQKRQPDQVVAWLYRVVRNGAISAARSHRRRRQREAKTTPREPWFTSVDDRIDAERAAQVLAEVDPESREVIVARIWGGLTFEQAAEVMGCSAATAHRRYQAGLAQLQERLERTWTPPVDTQTTR